MPLYIPRRRRLAVPEIVPESRWTLTVMQSLGRLRLVRSGVTWTKAHRIVRKPHGWRKGLARP